MCVWMDGMPDGDVPCSFPPALDGPPHTTHHHHPNNPNKQEQFQLERTANRIVATTQAPVPGSSGSGSAPTHAHAHRGNASGGAQGQFEKEEREERARAEKRAAQRGVRDKVCGGVWCGMT